MYDDLDGQACAYAAAVLNETGLFTGERIGSRLCFCPEKTVTRAEFLSLCLQLDGSAEGFAVMRTAYEDDKAITAWVKECWVSAQLYGFAPGNEEFCAFDPVRADEAGEWLNAALRLTEIGYRDPSDAETQAYLNLTAHGIPAVSGDTVLTRAEAAEMLAAAWKLNNK